MYNVPQNYDLPKLTSIHLFFLKPICESDLIIKDVIPIVEPDVTAGCVLQKLRHAN